MATVVRGSDFGPELGALLGLFQMLQGNSQYNQEKEARDVYAKQVTDILSGRQTAAEEQVPVKMFLPSGEKWSKNFPRERSYTPEEQVSEDNQLRAKLAALGATVPHEMRVNPWDVVPGEYDRRLTPPPAKSGGAGRSNATRDYVLVDQQGNLIPNPETGNQHAVSGHGVPPIPKWAKNAQWIRMPSNYAGSALQLSKKEMQDIIRKMVSPDKKSDNSTNNNAGGYEPPWKKKK